MSFLSLVAAVALCLLLTGCVSRRIAWSPDGAHAVIFAGDGLHLCGPDGALSDIVLPAKPGFYKISPDGKRVAILAEKGAVVVITLATGALDTVQAAGGDDTASAPAWRSASELCFISSANGQPTQVALWNNGTTRVLSANWPAGVRKGFLEK